MDKRDFVIKERAVWDPRCLQLLRERATARYALKVAPRVVDGTAIHFPETRVSLGLWVAVSSRRVRGRNLLEMIYDQETQALAVDMAIIALRALDNADVTCGPFILFGMAYGLVRRLKVGLNERLGAPVLSPEQRARLNHLVSSYLRPGENGRAVLVHGDLHAGNVVVNCEERSLGFVDLEMMHLGKSVTNFAQLWISFHLAGPSLGQRFYQRYVSQFSETLGKHFDSDMRAEVALRCHTLVREAEKTGHAELEAKARALLGDVLADEGFLQERPR